jgi:hypothetical protein
VLLLSRIQDGIDQWVYQSVNHLYNYNAPPKQHSGEPAMNSNKSTLCIWRMGALVNSSLALVALTVMLRADIVRAQQVSSAPPPARTQVQPSANDGGAKKHYLVALEALKKNDLPVALDELKQAAALAPSNALIWYNIAVVESKKGDSKAALEHLHKATSLGLPPSQQNAVDDLDAKLTYDLKKKQLSDKPPGTPAVPKTTPGATESSMRALNAVINEIYATTADHQAIGFIFETSTGKLWWKSLEKRGCGDKLVAIWMVGVRLDALDPDNFARIKDFLSLTCKGWSDCLESWSSPICTSVEMLHGMGSLKEYESPYVEVINKEFDYRIKGQGDVKTSFTFMGRAGMVGIATTGDPDGMQRAIDLLKQLITSKQSHSR